MSAREAERIEVMRRVEKGTLTVRAAATVLAVSYRQAKRIWRRYQAGGAAAMIHRQVGRPSNRGRSAEERERVLGLVRQKYSVYRFTRFGPTLAAQHLASEELRR